MQEKPIVVAAGTVYQCRFCADWVVCDPKQESSLPWRVGVITLSGLLMERGRPDGELPLVACGRCRERLESQGRLCAANPQF